MMFKRKILVISAFLLFILSLGMVCASDNVTEDSIMVDGDSSFEPVENSSVENTHIETNPINSYYNGKTSFSCYLKDSDGNPVGNKNLIISLNGKVYNKTTGADGSVKLSLNLKSNSYKAIINFAGDDDYASSMNSAVIKIKKAPAIIKTSNYNTYVNSDLFFKAKVYNKATNNPISGIKVLFKVYSIKTKKFTKYYAITNKNGVATLNKNLKVGSYIVYTYVSDKSVSYKKSKATMNVLPTAEMGCCSIYVQINNTDSICGFRRDSTYAADLHIDTQNFYGRTAIKQYKNAGGYSFHLITTSDGWMIGTGGADSASINKKIECLAGRMVADGKFDNAKLRTIRSYINQLGIGHFVIKAPNGKYVIVWIGGYKFGKLAPGQFISVPNFQSCFRTGNYASYGKDPLSAALKIIATDPYGINKRDIVLYHLTKTTKSYKTTSSVKVYAANDNGKYSNKGDKSYLKDNIYFKGKYYSKNSLPYPLSKKYLGSHSFGNIDKLVKVPTVVKAPEVSNQFNKTKYFKVFVKDKSKNPISGIKVKLKVTKNNFTKYYTLTTNENGRVIINTKDLDVGSYNVQIMQANNKYYISAKSKFKITLS